MALVNNHNKTKITYVTPINPIESNKKASGKGTCYETNETKKIKNIIENLNNDCNSKSSKKK